MPCLSHSLWLHHSESVTLLYDQAQVERTDDHLFYKLHFICKFFVIAEPQLTKGGITSTESNY